MRHTTTRAFLVVSLVAAAACSADTPVGTVQDPSFVIVDPGDGGGGDAPDKVTGSGHILLGDELRTFSFNAKVQKDGSVTGQWQMNDRYAGTVAHGTVTCLTGAGNQAWIGGTVTSSSDPALVGRGAYWRVVDNGEGSSASPDEISEIPYYGPPESAGDACTSMPFTPDLYQVRNGNVQFH